MSASPTPTGGQGGLEGVETQAVGAAQRGPGADDGRPRPVGKQAGGDQGVGVVVDPHVNRAQLGGDDQHHRVRVGLAKGFRHLHGRKRRVAAHEAHVEALCLRREVQGAHHVVVGSRRIKAGARHGDDVGDVAWLQIGAARHRLPPGLGKQLGRGLGVEVVADPGTRKQQLARNRVVEGADPVLRVAAQLVDAAVALVDRRGVVDHADQSLREALELRLGLHHVSQLALEVDGFRNGSGDRVCVNRHSAG